MNESLWRFWKDEEGQDLVEYSLLLAFIALAAIAFLEGIKTNIGSIWSKLNNSLVSANPTSP